MTSRQLIPLTKNSVLFVNKPNKRITRWEQLFLAKCVPVVIWIFRATRGK